MKYIKLYRAYNGNDCTLGMLGSNDYDLPPLYTLEEPWKNNERKISCVPKGVYKCVPHQGTRFKNVWRLENVPNRDAILIHMGNSVTDIEGCILVGMEHGLLRGKKAVLRSGEAIGIMKQRIGVRETFMLEIVS